MGARGGGGGGAPGAQMKATLYAGGVRGGAGDGGEAAAEADDDRCDFGTVLLKVVVCVAKQQ